MSEGGELFREAKAPARRAARAAADPAKGDYRVLARRARPQTFADVIGQEHVTQTLVNAIRSDRLAHAFVFSGMRGVGKTTTARILAKALNCDRGPTAEPCNTCQNCIEITESRSLDVIEVDAASQTGIDAARELLETVKYRPASGRYRIYIIDEAHGLSKQAVDAFLKTLEEPPPHVKFILATTAAQKLPATILSRCQRYDFRAVSQETVVDALAALLEREGADVDRDALLGLARESGGSMRDATSLLDQVLAYGNGRIDSEVVAEALGLPDRRAVRGLVAAVARRDASEVLAVVASVHAGGVDAVRFCEGVLEHVRHLCVLATAGRGALADQSAAEIADLEQSLSAASMEAADLHRWFRIALETLGDLGRTSQPRLVLEMAFLRMATVVPVVPVEDLLSRLGAIESGRASPTPTGGMPARSAPRPAVSAAPAPTALGGGRARPGDTAPLGTRPPAAPSPERALAGEARGASSRANHAVLPEQARWQALVDSLQRESASRFFRLSYSRAIEIDDERLVVAVTGREAMAALLEREAKETIERAIEREFGRSLRFHPVVPGEAGADVEPPRADRATIDRQAREDPVVQLSVELLEGRVEAVVPRGRR